MQKHDLKKVIVCIPALNEEGSIASIIDKIKKLYPEEVTSHKGYFVETLVVNDGSTDKTEEITISKGVKIVSHPVNLGHGAAARTAIETAYEMGADVAVKIDADFQYDPAEIEKIILPILKDRVDISWGSRFAGKITYKMPLYRYAGNKFYIWLMNRLTHYKVSDANTGMMAFGRKYMSVFELHGNYDPPQQLLIDASHKHMRFTEVPVTFHPRLTGKSFITLAYPFYVFPETLRALIYADPLKVFSIIGLFSITFSVLYLALYLLAQKYTWDISYIFIRNLSLAALIIGVQCVFFGILADLIIKKRK